MNEQTARAEAIIARCHLALAIWMMRRTDREGARHALSSYRQHRKAIWGCGKKSVNRIVADGHCWPTRKAAA